MHGKDGLWRKKVMCGYDGTFNDWLLEQRDEAFDNYYTVLDLADQVGAPVRSLYSALSRAGIRWPVGPCRKLYAKREGNAHPKWAQKQMAEIGCTHVRVYLQGLAVIAKHEQQSIKEVAEAHGLTPEGLDYHLQKWGIDWPVMYHTRGRLEGLRKAGKRQQGKFRKYIEHEGKQWAYTELCRHYGVHPNTVRYRITPIEKGGAGLSLKQALTLKTNERKRLPPALRKRNAELRGRV